MDILDNEYDKMEVLKFVRNKVYGSLMDSIEAHKLFDRTDLSYWRAYEDMVNSVRRVSSHYYSLELGEDKYALPINHFEPIVFYHKYGIPELPTSVKASIAERDVIDAGAFIGDSAIILSELNPRKIYAFEPLREHVLLLRRTIELNNLKNVVIVEKALGCKEGSSFMFSVSSGSFIHGSGFKEVLMTTVDGFVSKNSLDVALIKMDVEGYELEVVKGAKRTIQEYTPVLLISLYHTGDAFFEIPRLLKSLVPKYKFRFLNLNRRHATFERILIAYV